MIVPSSRVPDSRHFIHTSFSLSASRMIAALTSGIDVNMRTKFCTHLVAAPHHLSPAGSRLVLIVLGEAAGDRVGIVPRDGGNEGFGAFARSGHSPNVRARLIEVNGLAEPLRDRRCHWVMTLIETSVQAPELAACVKSRRGTQLRSVTYRRVQPYASLCTLVSEPIVVVCLRWRKPWNQGCFNMTRRAKATRSC